MNYKTCTKCGKELEATLEFFSPNKRRKDGLSSWCKKCKKQYDKERYKSNKKEILQRNYKYRKNNLESCRRRGRKYARNNPEKFAAKTAKRRALKLNQTPKFTESEDKQIKLIYKKSQELGPGWQVDHIQPVSKGGLHHPDNLQIVTASYNLQKSDKLNFRLPTEKEIIT